jgi:hypothetical protein
LYETLNEGHFPGSSDKLIITSYTDVVVVFIFPTIACFILLLSVFLLAFFVLFSLLILPFCSSLVKNMRLPSLIIPSAYIRGEGGSISTCDLFSPMRGIVDVFKRESCCSFRNIELLGGQVDQLIEKWKIREEALLPSLLEIIS